MVSSRLGVGVLVLALGGIAGACSTGGTGGGLADGGTEGGTSSGGTSSGGTSSGGTSSGGTSSGGTSSGGTATCPPTALAAVTEGCTLTLRAPQDCATVSLPAEFSWEGDACHTPYYLQIAGNPIDEENYTSITVNTEPINALAWAEPVKASAISGLKTTDGWYHWRVCNAYQSGCSASRAFRLP